MLFKKRETTQSPWRLHSNGEIDGRMQECGGSIKQKVGMAKAKVQKMCER